MPSPMMPSNARRSTQIRGGTATTALATRSRNRRSVASLIACSLPTSARQYLQPSRSRTTSDRVSLLMAHHKARSADERMRTSAFSARIRYSANSAAIATAPADRRRSIPRRTGIAMRGWISAAASACMAGTNVRRSMTGNRIMAVNTRKAFGIASNAARLHREGEGAARVDRREQSAARGELPARLLACIVIAELRRDIEIPRRRSHSAAAPSSDGNVIRN